MKKVVALVGVLAAAFLFFWISQKGEVEEKTATPDFSQPEQVERSEDFFTNRDLNELEAVNYSKYSDLLADLSDGESPIRKSTQQEFVGAKANGTGNSWTAYFEK
ncbi:hypothetical protein P7H46_04585 [Enterococcus pseudoavium]|uniref:Uncharacterized protein n=1 Tax=Enterococcus pseudoavium TaxID=44007 RepID=A0ABU3FGE9_9ENTE|nr:hypothetical protein [Enterococcus pseudoavium]MDT2754099.1 hypothetical protein [Enterococcus pseudoavium]MDT2770119.1 hypothetical protein [Enterococcus pseudoavium]REC32778.1 hypothetical protein CF160_10215 [Enterococcus pseudoavium]